MPLLIFQSPEFLHDFALYILLASWIIGMLYWALSKLILDPIFKKICPYIFCSNNLTWINRIYKEIKEKYNIGYRDLIEGKLSLKEYLEVYYRVQKNGLLGNAPILECYSEFFKNIIIVSIEWILFILIYLLLHCPCSFYKAAKYFTGEDGNGILIEIIILILVIFGVLGILGAFARKYTEKKIYSLILETDLLGASN